MMFGFFILTLFSCVLMFILMLCVSVLQVTISNIFYKTMHQMKWPETVNNRVTVGLIFSRWTDKHEEVESVAVRLVDDRYGSSSRAQALRGYTPTHTNISVYGQIFLCVGVCNCTAYREEGEHKSVFSIFHAPGARHTRSDRDLSKRDKIIKLQATHFQLNGQNGVSMLPPAPQDSKYWQVYKLEQLPDKTLNHFPSR